MIITQKLNPQTEKENPLETANMHYKMPFMVM